MNKIAERLHGLRVKRGWSVGQLAYRAEVSRDHIYKLENGQRQRAGQEVLERLAGALATSPEYLVGATDVIAASEPRVSEDLAGYSPLSADALELAARVDALSPPARARIVAIIGAMLDLLGAPDADEDAGLNAEERELVGYLRKASPEKRVEIRTWLAELVADPEGQIATH